MGEGFLKTQKDSDYIQKGNMPMSRKIVLNTVAYQEVLKVNPRQVELIPEIKSLGIDYVEIRREYVTHGEEELKEIARAAQEQKVTLYYSVPDEIFINSQVNPKLEEYFKEAAILNAFQMKLTLGDLDKLTKQLSERLDGCLSRFSTKLTIENDQSKERGSAARLKSFMEEAESFGLQLGLTFDVANFVYFAENPIESAKVLKPYVQYVHIKNVRKQSGMLEGTDMESGDLDIRAILNEFPESVPCAIEYPCGGETSIKQKIQNDKKEIQSWVPVVK
jgi:sugar phosphate isomerase/epimerase